MSALRIQVFEVDRGDCILIHFPSGDLGLVDAGPANGRPYSQAMLKAILEGGRRLRFVCITHPHADHTSGLLAVLRHADIRVGELWHSMDTDLEQVLRFFNERLVPRLVGARFMERRMAHSKEVRTVLELFDEVDRRRLSFNRTLGDFQIIERIGRGRRAVEVICLAPDVVARNRYRRLLRSAILDERRTALTRYYANSISLVLLLRFGETQVVLGGDALKPNWRRIVTAVDTGRLLDMELGAHVFKASHHGGSNGFYQGMWPAVLADGAKVVVSSSLRHHPSQAFVAGLRGRWEVYCTKCGSYCASIGAPEVRHLDCFGDLDILVTGPGEEAQIVGARRCPIDELPCRLPFRLTAATA